jgi:hypothetical protein
MCSPLEDALGLTARRQLDVRYLAPPRREPSFLKPTPWRDILGWLVILAGAAMFVAALAVPLGDPALVAALAVGLRGGALVLDIDSGQAAAQRSLRGPAPLSHHLRA